MENAPARSTFGELRSQSWLRDLLAAFRCGLEELYGDRLKGLYLFGSHARGQATSESDLDVLIVLDEVTHYAGEVWRTGELTSSLSLDFGVSISRVFVSRRDWQRGESPFLVNVLEDAIAA